MHSTESISRLFDNFNKLRVLVIGDVMVDAYLFGKVERISPEAPVPVVAVQHRSNRPGGAANVALNIKALGAEPILCSVIGQDQKGSEFVEILNQHKLTSTGILNSKDRITTTKFRVIGNNTQMLRVDEEITTELNRREKDLLQHRIDRFLTHDKIDVIVFQDYNKGVISSGLIHKTIAAAREKGIPVVVDPKRKNFLNYKQVSLFKPNLKELFEGINMRFESPSDQKILDAVSSLQDKIDADMILVTLSEKGVLIRYREEGNTFGRHHLPAHLRNVADVSGAGDTVLSVAALCLALGQDPHTIASISNLAGGIVCEEVGVVPIDKNKLHDEVLRVLIA
jgi:D-glycero-beta-D-manno-heptose-7-phosphate kinase